ncbi:MAG: polysaccharide deacetylase family protein [Treponema sp.]|nr:polysaccharide deacetylase family protein [Treponema sp.]
MPRGTTLKPSVLQLVCICAVCAACAHPARAIIDESPASVAAISSGVAVQESVPPNESRTSPEKPPIEQALEAARQGKAKKYFIAEKDNITVKADIDAVNSRFTVVYDIARAEVDLSRTVLYVPFSIEDQETHEIRTGVLEDEGAPNAGILLAFDDDYYESWERTFEVFDKFGAKVTFFVQGQPLAFCKAALKRGHDVGYHTIHHLNLAKVSEAQFLEECTAEVGVFRGAGVPLDSFAYPFGLYESWMSDTLLGYFKILRGYGVAFRIYDTSAVRGFIASKALDNTLYKNDSEFKALTVLMLRAVKLIGGVLPLTTHDVSVHADWGITPVRLEFLLKTAMDLKLKFYVYRDFPSPVE